MATAAGFPLTTWSDVGPYTRRDQVTDPSVNRGRRNPDPLRQ